MAVSAKWFGLGLKGQFNTTAANRIDYLTDTIKSSLHTSSYTPDQDAHDFFDDCTNELGATGGYTAGGVTLAGKTLTYDSATNEIRLDANDAQWTSATFTCRILVTRKAAGGASSADPLMGYVDFGGDESVSSGTFTVQWDSTGVMKVTAA